MRREHREYYTWEASHHSSTSDTPHLPCLCSTFWSICSRFMVPGTRGSIYSFGVFFPFFVRRTYYCCDFLSPLFAIKHSKSHSLLIFVCKTWSSGGLPEGRAGTRLESPDRQYVSPVVGVVLLFKRFFYDDASCFCLPIQYLRSCRRLAAYLASHTVRYFCFV